MASGKLLRQLIRSGVDGDNTVFRKISEAVIALTVTALGTSLPEIAATVVAVTRRESALAVGNVIGSNLMNLGLVLGLSSLVIPLRQIDIDILSLSLFLGLTIFVFVMGFVFKQFARWTGVVLILSYVGYVVALVTLTTPA